MSNSVTLGVNRMPAKSLLTLCLLAAFAPSFAATTTIPSGTVVTKSAEYFLGNAANDSDILNVLGTGTQWNNSSTLNVGYNGSGTLNIENGGVASAYMGYIARKAGSTGSVKVTGAGSKWIVAYDLIVGVSGKGTLNIENGAVVSSSSGSVSGNQDSGGYAKVTGAGSQWNTYYLAVGSSGSGTLIIENGGAVNSTNTIIGDYTKGGSVTVSGAGSKLNAVSLKVGTYASSTLNIENGGVVNSSYGQVNNGTAIVTGAGSQWVISGDISLGSIGNPTLNIKNGAVVSNNNGTINWGSAVNVTGTGSQWNNASTIEVGTMNSGTLNILDSSKVTAQQLMIGTNGTVTLNGGALQVASGSMATGGVLNWTSGSLGYTANASVGSGLLASTTTLTAGKFLNVANNLAIDSGKSIALKGGQLSATTLTLNGGSVTSTGGVDLSRVGTLIGHGTVDGSVTGGSTNTITASAGTLTLGNASANGGYAFGGTLNVASQNVALLSADKAQLGVVTNLGAGGSLSTLNGANLLNGNTLTFNGDSSVQGAFTNNGSVAGSTGTLRFLNDVDGAGSFAGNIAFKAAYNPGNSPASVTFNGGNVTFDSSSVLNIELLGSAPGTGYDQLVGINTLNFNGKLNLVFGNDYVPASGSTFALFAFNNFTGSFGTAADGYSSITVTGYDRTKLDFSHLATDGRLSLVTAVPEPESYALMLAGLALIGVVARRRKAAEVI